MLDISGKIDTLSLRVLKQIKEIADSLQINFFLVGATVRDMILNYVYDIKVYRATNDMDFAIRLKSWDEYSELTAAVEKAGFRKDQRMAHRFYTDALTIDFIPFGEIADENENIIWQDSDKREMNVAGFDDAYMNTEEILIQTDPDIKINSASVESLVILKIFAWNERATEIRLKDATDLYLIISSYLRAGNEERLFIDHSDIVEASKEYEFTGARLLGRDITQTASSRIKNNLLEILRGDKLYLLAVEMAQYEGLSLERDEKIEKCLELLNNLLIGLEE